MLSVSNIGFSKVKRILKDRLYILKGMSIIKKLILSYIIILTIPSLIISFYYFNIYESNINKALLKDGRQRLKDMDLSTTRNAEVLKSVQQTVTSNKRLMDMLSKRKEISAKELVANKDLYFYDLSRVLAANPNIYQIRFFINNKAFLEIWPFIYEENRLKGYSWLKKITRLDGDYYWRFNHIDRSFSSQQTASKNVVSLYSEIKDTSYKHLGVIEINMPADIFFNEMYRTGEVEDSYILVLNNEEVFFRENQDFFRRSNLKKNFVTHELMRRTKGENGCFSLDSGNGYKDNLLVIYSYCKSINSYVYNIIVKENVIKQINKTRYLVLLICFGTIVVLSIVTFIMTSVILKKLRIIINFMRTVQEGKLDVDIPVRGNDEMGELAHHFRKMLRKINELISIIMKKQAAVKDAEINALHNQINRHYIYNALERVRYMADSRGENEISEAVVSLASTMKYSMKWTKQFVPLKDEIDYIRNYFISSLGVGKEDAVFIEFYVEEAHLKIEVLKMTLQPVIENSLYHGIGPRGNGMIKVLTSIDQGFLNIDIVDNGVGMNKERLERLRETMLYDLNLEDNSNGGNGIGLRNVNERIKLFYGKEYGISIWSEENIYTKVRITFPSGKGGEYAK